jgi:hypothetical protein
LGAEPPRSPAVDGRSITELNVTNVYDIYAGPKHFQPIFHEAPSNDCGLLLSSEISTCFGYRNPPRNRLCLLNHREFHFLGRQNNSGIQNLQIIFLSGNFTVIPKGVNDFRVKAQYTLPHDAELVVCVPHAHHLARWIEINLYEPNQTNPKLLIRVPRWDFNWQAAYYADPPVRLVAGTKLEAIVSYDNTVENPFNPFNPPRPAWHAENTADEMLLPMLSLSSRHVLDPSQASFSEFMSKVSLSRFSRRLVEHRYKYLRNPDGTIVRSPYFNPVTDE